MRICVVGSGYVGLVSGACLADFGMIVVGIDKDSEKISALQRGEIPIYEPGLGTLVRKNAQAGRLSFSTDLGASPTPATAAPHHLRRARCPRNLHRSGHPRAPRGRCPEGCHADG